MPIASAPVAPSARRLCAVACSGLGCGEKKKTLRAAEQDRPEIQAERAAFLARVSAIAPERLVFVDESGVLTNLVRLYARAPGGSGPAARHRLGVGSGSRFWAPWPKAAWRQP